MKYFRLCGEFIINFILIHSFLGVSWLNRVYGHTTGDEKIFHLLVPLDGVNSDYFHSYFFSSIIPTIILAVILFLIIQKTNITKKIYVLLVIVSLAFAIYQLDLPKYIFDNINTSNFIEENYVDPKTSKITFENPKNLIYIYLESMENTYMAKEEGGAFEKNLIPNLTALAKNNISFSNTSQLGGALYIEGSCFTVASMMAQISGLPLKVNYSKEGIIDFNHFFKGVTLGDILYKNGYDNYIIMGSNSKYGARDVLYKEHHYNISDVNTAIQNKKMTEDDKVWWGYPDKKLFEYAKEELTIISQKNKPFNYTMLTVDTHFEDGYLDESCQTPYKDRYSNVISCNDKMIMDFLEWIKKQSFYDNTVIVLVGDHISMDQNFFKNIDKNYQRTTYNVFINVDQNANIFNRQFTQLDMFPTTISAIGGKIEGDRLALGTNLFSNRKTLIEEKGYDYVRKELTKRSEFYNSFLARK